MTMQFANRNESSYWKLKSLWCILYRQTLALKNLIWDSWVTWELISQKLMFWWQGGEGRGWGPSMWSCLLQRFFAGDLSHSTSVSFPGEFISFHFEMEGQFRSPSCPRFGVTLLHKRRTFFNLLWPQIRGVFWYLTWFIPTHKSCFGTSTSECISLLALSQRVHLLDDCMTVHSWTNRTTLTACLVELELRC